MRKASIDRQIDEEYLQGALALAVSWIDTDTLINYVTFVMWAQRCVTMLALLLIRYKGMPVHPGLSSFDALTETYPETIRVPVVLSVIFAAMSAGLCIIPLVQEFKVRWDCKRNINFLQFICTNRKLETYMFR